MTNPRISLDNFRSPRSAGRALAVAHAASGCATLDREPGDEVSSRLSSVRTVTLETAVGGLVVVAENGSGGALDANLPAASTRELFTLSIEHQVRAHPLPVGEP